MTDLDVSDYNERAIVVRGDTKPHKENLSKMGGKWNTRLKGGAGWIFSKKFEDKVLYYAEHGKFDSTKNSPKKYERKFKTSSSDEIAQYRKLVEKLVSITLTSIPGGVSLNVKEKLDKALKKRYSGYEGSKLQKAVMPKEDSSEEDEELPARLLPRGQNRK